MRRLPTALLLLASLACRFEPVATPPVVVTARGRNVPVFDAATSFDGRAVVFTHPSESVLRRAQGLVARGLLAADNLRVVGLFHTDEWRDYSGSEALVRDAGASWLRLMRLDCALDQPFHTNACTPVFENLVEQAAGLVFTGGADLPPALYGEKTSLLSVVETPNRAWEVSLLYHLLGRGQADAPAPLLTSRPDLPVLAICMGMQATNVATGGTLIQDIPSELYGIQTIEDGLAQAPEFVHRNFNYLLHPAPGVGWGVLHPIALEGESPLLALAPPNGEPVQVLSVHHQAAGRLGRGLRVVARSLDGLVVEAVVHESFPRYLGVQFHPETMVLWDAELPFAVREGDAQRNFVAEAMQSDVASAAFHRGLWQIVSGWVAETRPPARR